MSTSKVSAMKAGLVDRITSVFDGRVYDHDPWHRDDVVSLLTVEINGMPYVRGAWIRGPSMASRWETAGAYTGVWRIWTFDIEVIEGLAPGQPGDTREPGSDILTVGDNAQAICDAIDADKDIGLVYDGGTGLGVFASKPCTWSQMPEHVGYLVNKLVCSRVVITKELTTFVGP